jgi:hypothetical protein
MRGKGAIFSVDIWTLRLRLAILSAMESIWEGRISGDFHGYVGGIVHELSDGSRWRQESLTCEYVYRERPKARLLRDKSIGKTFLDVEGTSAVVEVVPVTGLRGMGAGPL